jgi:hypothetical protein
MMLASLASIKLSRLGMTMGTDVSFVAGRDLVVRLTPEPSDGPILVTVSYWVRSENIFAFISAMNSTGRYRRATGARQWRLYRDLSDPNRFVETFLVASWAEHLRQHERFTVAADSRLEVVRNLTEGPNRWSTYLPSAAPQDSNRAS